MRVHTCVALSCLAILAALALMGCPKKANQSPSAPSTGTTAGAGVTADAEKPLADVQAQAQKMSTADLRATALQYKQAITLKQEDLQKLLAQVKEMPLTEALGEKAKSLKNEAQKIESHLKALTERFQVYFNQLKEKGGDVSGLTV